VQNAKLVEHRVFVCCKTKISIKFVGTVRPCNKLPAVQGHYRSPPHIRMRVLFARLKHTKRLPAGMSQSDCRVCKQTSRSSRGTRVRESACAKRFDGSAVKRFKTIFAQSPPPLRGSVSLRLGHGAALTTHRVVIHYRAVTSLPLGGSLGRDHRRAFVC
jgi:hypothetical protein